TSRSRVTVAATASAISGSACSQPRPMESKAQALVKPAASISRAAAAMADAVSGGELEPPEGSAIPNRVMGWSMLSGEKESQHALRHLHEHGPADLGGRAGPLEAPRGHRLGRRLCHRPLHAQHA